MELVTYIPQLVNRYRVFEKSNNQYVLSVQYNEENIAYYNCDTEIIRIIELIDGERSIEEIRLILERKFGVVTDHEYLYDLLKNKLHKLTADQINPKEKTTQYLFLKCTLVSRKIVEFFSGYFRILFKSEKLMWAMFIFNISLFVLFYLNYDFHFIHSPRSYFIAAVTMTLSLLLHELGHAAASYAYGARPGPIGFAFYLFTPVLYADVTNAWTLSKSQRLIVDAAGVFMESLLVTLNIVLVLLTGNSVFYIAAVTIAFNSVININPLLRFDGYWFLSDLTDTPNLKRKANLALKKVIRFHKQPFSGKELFLAIYGFMSYMMLFSFLYYVLRYHYFDILTLPLNIYRLFSHIITGSFNEIHNISSIMLPAIFLFIVVKWLINFKKNA